MSELILKDCNPQLKNTFRRDRHRMIATLDPHQVWLRNRMWGAVHHFKLRRTPVLAKSLREIVSDDFVGLEDKIVDGRIANLFSWYLLLTSSCL
jgi:hypothetical protein